MFSSSSSSSSSNQSIRSRFARPNRRQAGCGDVTPSSSASRRGRRDVVTSRRHGNGRQAAAGGGCSGHAAGGGGTVVVRLYRQGPQGADAAARSRRSAGDPHQVRRRQWALHTAANTSVSRYDMIPSLPSTMMSKCRLFVVVCTAETYRLRYVFVGLFYISLVYC